MTALTEQSEKLQSLIERKRAADLELAAARTEMDRCASASKRLATEINNAEHRLVLLARGMSEDAADAILQELSTSMFTQEGYP